MIDIRIRTIPHDEQRYSTVGDWQTEEEGFDGETILVSDLGDRRMEACIAIHELLEMLLCQDRGISAKLITDFDKSHETEEDPGSHRMSPYMREHNFATILEFLLLSEFGIERKDYEERIRSL